MFNSLTQFNGICFIGDPHISSERPGRRTDDYFASSLDKLWQASQLCNEKGLLPVILGDLIHRENESSIVLVHRLMQVLQSFPCIPLDLGGNHGKRQFNYTEGDIESVMQQAGCLRLLNQPGEVLRFEVSGESVDLVAFPYGTVFPKSIESDARYVLGISHHDLMFGPGYPGALEQPEIKGVQFVVNGHMHKTYPSKQVGETLWHCPGNTEPLSVDVADHKPAVWVWTPEQNNALEPHYLKSAHSFDLTGRIVNQASEKEALHALQEETTFAPMLALASAANDQGAKTTDMAILQEDVESIIGIANPSELAIQILRNLMAQTLGESKQPE